MSRLLIILSAELTPPSKKLRSRNDHSINYRNLETPLTVALVVNSCRRGDARESFAGAVVRYEPFVNCAPAASCRAEDVCRRHSWLSGRRLFT